MVITSGLRCGGKNQTMLRIDIDGAVARVTLDRPEVHNAFNEELIARLTETFRDLDRRPAVRVVVLAGEGPSFSAGGDLQWMRRAAGYTFEENLRDARAAAEMFRTIHACGKPVIARVHGAALGGGAGLAAAADLAMAVESAVFGFTEVRWGLVPGVIAAFVVRRIGAGRAREFFITGERFPARTAHEIGLVHAVVGDAAALDAAIDGKVRLLLEAAPGAIAATKQLIEEVAGRPLEDALEYAVEALARARSGDEGKAGVNAFLERTPPPWVE